MAKDDKSKAKDDKRLHPALPNVLILQWLLIVSLSQCQTEAVRARPDSGVRCSDKCGISPGQPQVQSVGEAEGEGGVL